MDDLPTAPTPDQPVTGLKSDGKRQGMIVLSVPNLLPTDNASQIREIEIERVKIPVRITQVNITAVDNGYSVNLPQAGQQNRWGPDGAQHVFPEKQELMEFVSMVLGQVTYQYRETEICEVESGNPPDSVQPRG